MEQKTPPAISRLVAAHQGAVALSRALGGVPAYQEVQRWVARGWASPMHILRLEPFLLEGMSIRDLHVDRQRAKDMARMPPVKARGRQNSARAA